MPYKLKAERLSAQRRWYATHDGAKDKVVAAKQRYQQRNFAIVDEMLAERCPCGLADEAHLTIRRLVARRVAHRPSSVAKVVATIEECPNR